MHSYKERKRKPCNPVRLAALQPCYSRFYLQLRLERHNFLFSILSVFTKIPELTHAWESSSEFLSYTFLQVELRVGRNPQFRRTAAICRIQVSDSHKITNIQAPNTQN